jgi:hypothetical protein
VAWKVAGADQYSIWSTDSNGNYISNNVAGISGAVSGTNTALQTIENTFHQDLNGDGVIGIPQVSATVIQTDGSTSLTQIGANYYLYNAGAGPELKSGGAPVTAGEFGGWTPIGAVQTASGYDVAWKVAGADQYSVWSTDSNGNYISNNVAGISGAVSGTNTALQTIENTFHQDLNGDGVIGVPPAATSPVATNNAVSNFAGSGTINATAAAGSDSFVFAPNFGNVTITNVPSTGLEFSNTVFANTNALLAAAHDDGHGNVTITDATHDTLTIQNMTLAQLHTHQSDFHIV